MHAEREKNRNTGIIAFFAVIFTVTWLLTAMTPLIGDDFNYAFSWADHSRIDNFVLVVESMSSHRLWTHGRVFAQGWVTLFVMWPKWCFSFANSIVVTVFFFALYSFFARTGTSNPLLSCLIIAAIYWICMPAFGQVFLWLDGACNYFWGAALAWCLLETVQVTKTKPYRIISITLLLPLAFAVGAWSEHISFAVIIIQLFLVFEYVVCHKKLPVSECLILLTCSTGYLYLMLSPSMLPSKLTKRAGGAIHAHLKAASNYVSEKWWMILFAVALIIVIWIWLKKKADRRSRYSAAATVVAVLCLTADLYYVISTICAEGFYMLISSTQVGYLSLASCFFWLLGKAIRVDIKRDIVLQAGFFFVGGLSALIPFSLAMYIPARGFCAPIVFGGIAVVMLWGALNHHGIVLSKIAVFAFCVVFVLCFVVGVMDIFQVWRASENREEAIHQALDTDGIVITSPYPEKTKYSAQYGIQDLTEDGSWPNDVIAEYYGLKEILTVAGTGDRS